MERIGKVQIWRKLGGCDKKKEAELAETYDMTSQQRALPPRTLPIKTSSARVMSPHIDVTGLDAPRGQQMKTAQRLAMPSLGMYPLDSYGQVKQAAAYFGSTFPVMPPEARYEFCQHLVPRARELGVPVSALAEKYGSAKYASAGDIEACLVTRRMNILDPLQLAVLDKLSAAREQMEPEDFAIALGELDKAAGLHVHYGDIPDPYYTTFGKEAAPADAVIVGNEYISQERLALYLGNNVGTIGRRFGQEVAQALAAKPQEIFDSLPRDQKLIIMRMANNDDSPVQRNEPTA